MTTKLKYTETFDTLSSDVDPVTFPAVTLPEPVISFSITPKSKEDRSGKGRLSQCEKADFDYGSEAVHQTGGAYGLLCH